jgi:hypothetical protein
MANVIGELSKTTEGKTWEDAFYKSMGEAYKNAWLPYDSTTKNIINLFFPIHIPAAQFYDLIMTNTEKFLDGVYSDDINWDDVLSDVRGLDEYKNISVEEWKKIEDFLKNSGRDMNDVINMDMNQVNEDLKTVESISLEDTTTWEPGFMAWTRLRLLTDATFSTETGMGKAKNPVNGQFKTYEIQPANKTFRERENR